MEIMFVCLANWNRSVKGAEVMSRLCAERGLDHEITSAGVNVSVPWANQITKEKADKADLIFAAYDDVYKSLISGYGQSKDRLVNLGIPDHYKKDDLKLQEILEEKLSAWLEGEYDPVAEESIDSRLARFLDSVNSANLTKGEVDGFPASLFKSISFEGDFCVLKSGYDIQSAYDGSTSTTSYYLKQERFKLLLERLMYHPIAFNLGSVEDKTIESWDHSYEFDDNKSVVLRGGLLRGRLSLNDYAFSEYHLDFTPSGEKLRFDDVGLYTHADIERLMPVSSSDTHIYD